MTSADPPAPPVPPRHRSRLITFGLACVVAAGCAITLVAFAGRWSFLADLLANFRVQFLLLALLITLACLAFRRRKLAVAAAIGALINAATIVPLYIPPAKPTDSIGGPELRLMHLNVYYRNTAYDRVAAEMNASNADVIFLQEGMDDVWISNLTPLVPNYELVVRGDGYGPRGVALWLRRDTAPRVRLRDADVINLVPQHADIRSIAAVVEVDGTPVSLLSLHPPPPMTRTRKAIRDAQLAAAGDWAARQSNPCVVIGDLNATLWTHGFRQLASRGNLANSQRGHGISATWGDRSKPWAGRIPIDHCLHSRDIVTLARHVSDAAGSDHSSLHITLGLPKAVQGKER